MKKIRSLFVLSLISCILFSGCDLIISNILDDDNKKNESKDGYFPYNAETEKVQFDSKYDGKNCFVILTNHSKEYKNQENNASMTIHKGVFNMGNGFIRDEIHFSIPETPRNINRTVEINSTKEKKYRSLSNTDFHYASGLTSNGNLIYNHQNFELKVTGKHSRIWYLDNNKSINITISNNKFNALKETVDTIFEKEIQIFGSNIPSGANLIDVDSSTKLDILIYDLFGDAIKDQKQGTFGFFNPNDLYYNYSNSNNCEVIHIDSNFLSYDSNEYNNQNGTESHLIDSTIIHEFQHLLNFCNKGDSNTWFNEMLSMCAEDIFQYTLNLTDNDSPKSRFSNSFYKPWLGFKNWNESSSTEVLYNYANAYAFGAYLMRNYNGVKFIHEIATNDSVNEESITKALNDIGYTDENFYSVLNKFGKIYIYDKKNTISLNKNITDNESTLKAIDLYDLDNYYTFNVYDNQNELENDIKNNLYITSKFNNRDVMATDNKKYYIRIPRIFKNYQGFKEELNPYGFVVYYLGIVDSSKEYDVIKVEEPISKTFVFID